MSPTPAPPPAKALSCPQKALWGGIGGNWGQTPILFVGYRGAACRISVVAGSAGALASIGWFTAFALTSAANVRTLGMVEVVFSYLVSRRLLREKLAPAEQAGLVLTGVAALLFS